MKRCIKCNLPETHETITFDAFGVCNICNQQTFKRESIDWSKRKKDLDALVEEYRGRYDYDCIVPFSGGKDSTWTLYYLMKEYGLKPLVVRFDHGFLRQNVIDNTDRVLRRLGADFLHFRPNWKVVQKLMLQSFLEKGDFCWHCHTGIFSYPMWVAIQYNVPLISGESRRPNTRRTIHTTNPRKWTKNASIARLTSALPHRTCSCAWEVK